MRSAVVLAGAIDRTIERLVSERAARGARGVLRPLERRRNLFSEVAFIELDGERLFVKALPQRNAHGADVAAAGARAVAAESELLFRLAREGVAAPRPVAHYPDVLTLVTTVCEGRPLSEEIAGALGLRGLFGRRAPRAEALMEACGRWLAGFHGAVAMASRAATLDALGRYLRRRAHALASLDSARWDEHEARARIEALLARIAALPEATGGEVVIHGDFALHNLLWDGTRLAAIDFTNHGAGFREDDLRSFARSLARHVAARAVVPRIGARVARRLERAFRRAYRRAGGPVLASPHPVARAVAAKHALAAALSAWHDASAAPAVARRPALRLYERRAAEALALLGAHAGASRRARG